MKRPSLSDLQASLKQAITNPQSSEPFLKASWQARWIKESSSFSAEKRLEIYSNAYLLRLAESLSQDFATVKRITGLDLFLKIVAEYLDRHPSRSPNIADVGRDFSTFLDAFPLTSQVPYIGEAARLEWAIIETFYAPRAEALGLGSLQAVKPIDWELLKLDIAPGVKLLEFNWPLDRLWNAREDQAFENIEDTLMQEKTFLLVRSENGNPVVEPLSKLQFKLLTSLRASTLGGVLAALEPQLTDIPPEESLMLWFNGWMSKGVFAFLAFRKTATSCFPPDPII